MEDLEKKRDEICIPLSATILKIAGGELVNSKDNQKEIALKTLALMLDSDLNITSEVSYIPQLLLRNLSGLNAMMQTCEVIQPDQERYGNIANKIVSLLSEANIDVTVTTPER